MEVAAVSIDAENLTLAPGEKALLTAIVSPKNATFSELTWTSSNEDLLTVSENGEIAALKCGVVTVTATSANGVANTIAVEVRENPTVFEEMKEDEERTDGSTQETSDSSSAFTGFLVLVGVVALIIYIIRKR